MKDQARACAIELGEWLYWRTAGCSPEVAKMEAIITKHIAIAVREKDSEISELKDHCNLVWQLIKPFLPACPAKSRKLLKKAMEDSKKLRGEGSHRLAEAEFRLAKLQGVCEQAKGQLRNSYRVVKDGIVVYHQFSPQHFARLLILLSSEDQDIKSTTEIIKEQTDINFEQAVKIGKLEYKLERARGALEELKQFVRVITLDLQSHRSKTPQELDGMFHAVYRLYDKYDVEGRREALTDTGGEDGNGN